MTSYIETSGLKLEVALTALQALAFKGLCPLGANLTRTSQSVTKQWMRVWIIALRVDV